VRLSLPGQRVGHVVCSEESCEGLGPWKADDVGRILNQVLCLARARTVLWQLASDGVGRRWLVAILLSLRQSLDPGDGYGWVYSVAASAMNLVHFLFIAGGPMTGTPACLFWLWWVGGGSMPYFVWLFWPC
jgi:hypothetical protein